MIANKTEKTEKEGKDILTSTSDLVRYLSRKNYWIMQLFIC